MKEGLSRKLFLFCNTLFMLFMVVICLYPMLYILFASLSEENQLVGYLGPLIKPLGFSTAAYKAVFKNEMILNGYRNTFFIVIVGTLINLFFTAIGAFVLSRRNVMLKKPIMLMIIFTMYFSGGMIPFYFTVKDLGMENSIWSVIIPTAINTYNMIIMRTGFASVSVSLEEAARIDGANDYVVLFRVILPLAMPTVAVVALYYIVGHWNAWFNAMLFIRDKSIQPLQLILREILIQNDTNSMTTWSTDGSSQAFGETIKYAVIIFATIPVLIIYPFIQRFFVKGVMIGGVKE